LDYARKKDPYTRPVGEHGAYPKMMSRQLSGIERRRNRVIANDRQSLAILGEKPSSLLTGEDQAN
jgi:hypothetical protein